MGRAKIKLRLLFFALYIPVVLVVGDLTVTQIFPIKSIRDIRHLPWVKRQTRAGDFVIDPDIGFRPRFRTKRADKHGVIPNQYGDEPKLGVKRLLFIGDSVTEKGYLIEGLKSCYGQSHFEYWNGGVGSYTAEQVVNYYQKYLHKIDADHVIFTFHLNDWENTPVFFSNDDNSISAFEPQYGEMKISKFFYLNSNLYHLYLKYLMGSSRNFWLKAKSIQRSFRTLAKLTSNTSLTVLINPTALPLHEWSEEDLFRKIKTVELLKSEGIRYFDMSEFLGPAIKSKVEFDGKDIWHPGPKLSDFLARELCRRNLLSLPE